MHIVGAAKTILMCISNNPSYYHRNYSSAQTTMQRLVLESFFFHASRRPLFEKVAARSKAVSEAISLVQELCTSDELLANPAWSTSPLLGPKPKLFTYVYQLSLLQKQTALNAGDVDHCLHLEAELLDLESSLTDSDSLSENRDRDGCGNDATLGVQLYILACRLLLNRILHGFSTISNHALVTQALRIIHLVPAVGLDYHASYYLWPLSIIATSISQLVGHGLGPELGEEVHCMRAGNRSTEKLICFLLGNVGMLEMRHDS